MYTKPKIKKCDNRYYIEFYYKGERLREYNGNKLSLSIFPNRAKTAKERSNLLQELKTELLLWSVFSPTMGCESATGTVITPTRGKIFLRSA